MFEHCGYKFEIIKPELIGSFGSIGKSRTYKEHGFKLVVNKGATYVHVSKHQHQLLKLGADNIVVEHEQALRDVIAMWEAYRTKDIAKCVGLDGHVMAELGNGVYIQAVDTIDGVMWSVGHSLLPVSSHPTVESLQGYLGYEAAQKGFAMGSVTEPVANKLVALGYTGRIEFVLESKSKRRFAFEYDLLGDVLGVREEFGHSHWPTHDSDDSYLALFAVNSFEEAARICELFKLGSWEKLLQIGLSRADSDDALNVMRRVSSSFDLAICFSESPSERGYWLVPTDHSSQGFSSERVKVNRERVFLGVMPLQDALAMAVKPLSHPIEPVFKLLRWENIAPFVVADSQWSIQENNTGVTWNGTMLSVCFYALKDYPQPIKIPCDNFDDELINLWRIHAGALSNCD